MSRQIPNLRASSALLLLAAVVICYIYSPHALAAEAHSSGVAMKTELQDAAEAQEPGGEAANAGATSSPPEDLIQEEADPRENMHLQQTPAGKPGFSLQLSAEKAAISKILQVLSICAAVFVAFAMVTKGGADQTEVLTKLKSFLKLILSTGAASSSGGTLVVPLSLKEKDQNTEAVSETESDTKPAETLTENGEMS